MQHLVSEEARPALSGGASFREHPGSLFGRAILLSASGDAVTVTAQGRQVGVLLSKSTWGGIATIVVGAQRYAVDLYAETPTNWVFEAPLPASEPAPVTVAVGEGRHPDARATEVWVQTIYASSYTTAEIPDRIRQHVASAPVTEASVNQLTDVFKWYDADWRAAMDALNCSPAYVPPEFVHRKSWEWAQCIYGLDLLGALRPDARALGVGVGWEPLSFFFSNHLREVVATDLYPVDHQWSESGAREGNPTILENPDAFAPFAYQRDRVRFLRMDGKTLDFPDESFDVVWSCSSIEHFGGHPGAAASMREVERVLKPGGVACIITEYVLPDPVTGTHALFDAEYFNLRCLYEFLLRPLDRLQLVQNLDLSIPDYYVRRAVILPDEAGAPHEGSRKPHIVLRSPSGALHTSIALFYRKAGAVLQPSRRMFTAAGAASPHDGAAPPAAVARPSLPARPAARTPALLPAAVLAGVDEHGGHLTRLPFPLYAEGGTGVKAAGRRALNRVLRAVGAPHVAFGDSFRGFVTTLTPALHRQQEAVNGLATRLARVEQDLASLRSAAPALRDGVQENDLRQREHMVRMNALTADPDVRARIVAQMHDRYGTYLRDVLRPGAGVLLDLGCGYAEIWLEYLRGRGFTYYGMDLNDDVIAYMRERLQDQGDGEYVRKGQIEQLPFPDRFFDVVYASHILEHAIDIDRALAEIRRVLKGDGYLVFAVPCGYDDEPAHTHNREHHEWIEDLERNGYAIEVAGRFDFNMDEFYGRAVPRRSA